MEYIWCCWTRERISLLAVFDEVPFVPFPTPQPPPVLTIVLGRGGDDIDDGSEEHAAPQIGESWLAHALVPVHEAALPDIGEFEQKLEHAPNVMPAAAALPIAQDIPAPHPAIAGRPVRTNHS